MISHLEKNLNLLHLYSESLPFGVDAEFKTLYQELKNLEKKLNFPAVMDDVGSYLSFLTNTMQFKTIFEFGSGYGQSAFWFLMGNKATEKIYLTEKREDLKEVFAALPWPEEFKAKIEYYTGDAFEKVNSVKSFDLLLIDGVKADYLKFVKIAEEKLSQNGVVVIDNAFWRGSFLDEKLVETKVSAQNMKALHDYIKESKVWQSSFLPFSDGVILLSRRQ